MVQATRFTPRGPGFTGTAVQGRGGADLSGLGAGVAAMGEALLAEREKADQVDLARRVADFNIAQARAFDAEASAYDGSDGGFADRRRANFEAAAKETVEAAPERLRERLTLALERRRDEETLAAQRYEFSQTKQFALNGANAVVTAGRNAILSDPAQYEHMRAGLGDLAASLDEALRPGFIRDAEASYAAAHGDGRLNSDPAGLLAELRAGAFDTEMTPEDKRRLMRSAEVEIDRRRREAEARAREANIVRGVELRFLIDDDVASVAATGKGVEGLDPEEVARVLGADDLKRWEKARESARAAHGALAGLDAMSGGEIAQRLADLKPVGGKPGYKSAEGVYELAAQQAAAHLKARAGDPVRYYLDTDNQSALLWEAANEAASEGSTHAPALFERYARRMEAKQETGGLPRARLLPDATAKAMVAAIEDAPQGQRAEALRNLVMSLDDRFGDRADAVFDQLLDAKLPEAARVLRHVAHDPPAATVIARAIDAREDVKKILPQKDRNDIAEKVSSRLAPLLDTFDAYPDGPALMASYADVIGAAADYLAVREGLSPPKAARKAADLVSGNYDFVSTFRVPLEFDSRAVAAGAAAALDEALAGDGESLGLSRVFHGSLPDSDNKKLYAEHLAKEGRWVTTSGDAGLMLVDGDGQPVLDGEGRPIERDFADLAARGERRGVRASQVLPLGAAGVPTW